MLFVSFDRPAGRIVVVADPPARGAYLTTFDVVVQLSAEGGDWSRWHIGPRACSEIRAAAREGRLASVRLAIDQPGRPRAVIDSPTLAALLI